MQQSAGPQLNLRNQTSSQYFLRKSLPLEQEMKLRIMNCPFVYSLLECLPISESVEISDSILCIFNYKPKIKYCEYL